MPDEFVLLCETCGYEIEGLPREGACPECGRKIGTSLPAARLGTPVQRRFAVVPLLRTWHATLTRPRSTFDSASACVTQSAAIQAAALVLASAIAAGIVGVGLIAHEFGRVYYTSEQLVEARWVSAAYVVGALGCFGLGLAALYVLTFIEERGIRFWGPRRGWRITPTIARVVCAHACVGWVLGSVLAVAGHLVGRGLLEYTNQHNVGAFRGPMQLAPISLPVLGLVVGMLTFEILVYIGMGRMKYANRERPASDAPRDPAAPAGEKASPSVSPSESRDE